MTRTALLLLFVWLLPATACAAVFDQHLAASVFDTAFSFITPRTLEPESIPQLTLWGLRGLTALDPTLMPELRDDSLRLLQSGQPIFTAPLPPDPTPAAWGALTAAIINAAANASDPVRQAGTAGVIRFFFDELFNHLDPYSRYTPPGAAETDRERRSGQAGLGLTVVRQRGVVTVNQVIPGSPADDAGLRPGDRITAIDGRPAARLDAAALDAAIAGPDGSTVRLAWRSHDGRAHMEEIERAIVPPQTVTAERIGDILVIPITGFSVDTDQQFGDALAAGFTGHAVRGVVIDLRGNRGGLLRQAVAATDMILDANLVAITAGRHPQSSRVWPGGTGEDAAHGRPIVVLVDGRSASAAEIMAAALQDNGRAVVVGSSTLGKGLVQTISPLPDGGELFVTWSRVLAPAGWPLQGLGVMPQVCTSLGEDSLRSQLDSLLHGQLQMQGALARHNAARAPLPVAQVVELRNGCPAAEGRDGDMDAAQFLIDHPTAYAAALSPHLSDQTAVK